MVAGLKNDDDAIVLGPDSVALEWAFGRAFNIMAVKAVFRPMARAKEMVEFLIVINIATHVRADGADGKKASIITVDYYDFVAAFFRLDQKTNLRFEQDR